MYIIWICGNCGARVKLPIGTNPDEQGCWSSSKGNHAWYNAGYED